jgi:hypothetical protein
MFIALTVQAPMQMHADTTRLHVQGNQPQKVGNVSSLRYYCSGHASQSLLLLIAPIIQRQDWPTTQFVVLVFIAASILP